MTAIATHCPYCALQCGMYLVSTPIRMRAELSEGIPESAKRAAGTEGAAEDAGANRVRLTVAPRKDWPTNKGGLCQKGWTATELLTHPERLTTPLMRENRQAPLRPVSWEVALDRIAHEIVRVQERYGKEAVGVFGGGGLTNEKAYLLGKFARVALGTPHIDYNGRFCMASAATAGIKAFGLDRGLPFPLEDIATADALLLVGSNIAETMPPLMQYFEAQRRNGGALPVTQWAEEEGTMTNLEGRMQLRQQAVAPPSGVLTDSEILTALARRLGKGNYFTAEPRAIFEELRRASAGGAADYAGITYERIKRENGVFWPCPDENHPGTPRLFLDRFATPDGRANFHAVMYRPAAEEPDDEYPLYLTTGRVMAQYQSGTQTRRVGALNALAPTCFVEIHPLLASRFAIAEGDKVIVSTRRGTCEAHARLTSAIRQDTLFLPFHFAGRERANLLTNPALDPLSKMPEFKVCAARIELAKS